MFKVEFTQRGIKTLEKIPKELQIRIIKKIKFFASQTNPLIFSKPLVNLPPATHRFRVGDYRIAFYIASKYIYIEKVGHRKEIYYLEIET